MPLVSQSNRLYFMMLVKVIFKCSWCASFHCFQGRLEELPLRCICDRSPELLRHFFCSLLCFVCDITEFPFIPVEQSSVKSHLACALAPKVIY